MKRNIPKWQYEHGYEEYECAMQYLTDLEIPKEDEKDVFSLVGRIKQLEKRLLDQTSEVEAYYRKQLNSKKESFANKFDNKKE